MAHCIKCGSKTMLMAGTIYLETDTEPYESGIEEKSKTGTEEIDRHIIAQFCETCDEIISTSNH